MTATTDIEERRARWEARRALYGDNVPCLECGRMGTNVTHDPPEYRADDPYHRAYPDTPYHEFVAGGTPLPVTRHRRASRCRRL